MHTDCIKFGLFADPHYARRPDTKDRYYASALDKIRACYQVFQRENVDFAVCMGDLVDHASDPGAGRAELDELTALLRGEGLDIHLVLGNHDINTLPREELFRRGGFRPQAYYSFDQGGFHFAVLDSNHGPADQLYSMGSGTWDNTYIGAQQTQWLRDDLAAHAAQPAIILVHANLDPFSHDGQTDPHVVRDAAAVRAVLEAHPSPVTVFQGHYHPGRFHEENGIPYYTLRSIVGSPSGYFCMSAQTNPDGTVTAASWEG